MIILRRCQRTNLRRRSAGQLAQHRGKRLIFRYEGRDVSTGYHVTEVKSGAFQALDCGANFESWHETFIQLWTCRPKTTAASYRSENPAIIGKVAGEVVPFDPKAKVTFEVSDGKRAMQLYRASNLEADGNIVRVVLTQRRASCKPRDRWLEQQQSSSCAPRPVRSPAAIKSDARRIGGVATA